METRSRRANARLSHNPLDHSTPNVPRSNDTARPPNGRRNREYWDGIATGTVRQSPTGVLPIPHLHPTPVDRHIELWHLRYQRQIQVLRCQQAVTRRQVRVLPLLRKLLQVPYQVLEPRRTLALLQHSPRQRQLQQRLVCLLQTQQ